MPLSEDAKKELAEAIAIVKEDRTEKFLRRRFTAPPEKKGEEGEGDANDKKNDTGNGQEKGGEDAGKKKRSSYWGELGIDDD